MICLHKRFSADIWDRCCFDPMTLTVASVAASAAGAGASLYGGMKSADATLAGGDAAAQAGLMQRQAADFQAGQVEDNARQAFGAGQRQVLASDERTRLALSTLRANAAGSGVNPTVGSPASVASGIARRGSYNAAMDMFNGASTQSGLLNQAAGLRYSGVASEIGGKEARDASRIQADATIAGSVGSAFQQLGNAGLNYGKMKFSA